MVHRGCFTRMSDSASLPYWLKRTSYYCLLRGAVLGLLVFLRSCSSSRSLFITVVSIMLTADQFFSVVDSVVDINSSRVSASSADSSASSSSFLSSVKREHQKTTCSISSGTLHTVGHCGASSYLNLRSMDSNLIAIHLTINPRNKAISQSPIPRCIPFLLPSLEAIRCHVLLVFLLFL